MLAYRDHDNVNATLIEEEATLSSFDSDAVNDSEWIKGDSLVLGNLKAKDKPLPISVIKQRNDQSSQEDALGAVSDERKDDDDDDDYDDLIALPQFQEKTSAISCDKTSIYNLQDQSKKRSQS